VCLRCAGLRAFALGSDAPFESLSPAEASAGRAGTEADPGLPAAIGPYEIIEELGRGGMGRVFAARQRGLGRIVALKVLPMGASIALEMRFLREAQMVARLRHPHIVTIHDSGRANHHVYFSMDYIEGGDLARRMRERTFTPRESALLMAKVADALACAHAEGILHRDLKPSNILLDGEEPRLADFGLAAQLETGGDLTGASELLGTPHYLAPEAIRGGGAALTAASDVYALGIVLYALLTGRTPFAGASPAELPALLNETDPPAPRLLAPVVPRDLETICLHCLEREPARRYLGAAALAADLRHFLAGEPISARPPGRADRFRRFARRHRAELISASGVSAWLAVRATRAEKTAATEAAAARAISDFLQTDLLAQASPESQPDRDLKLRAVLDRAEKKIAGRFPSQPLVEAELRETLGNTYGALGEHVPERANLERALALLTPALGAAHPRVLQLSSQLATVLAFLVKNQEALDLGRRTLALTENTLGPEHPQTIRTLLDMATVTQNTGDYPAAERYAARALTVSRRVQGPDHRDTRRAMTFLASVYWSERKLAEAEPLNVEAVEAERRALGPEHPDTLNAMHNLASVYWAEGKLAESRQLGLTTLEIRRRVLGADHPETLRTQNNLATTYNDQGDFAAAVALHERTLAARKRLLGPEHTDTLSTTINLAMVHLRAGDFDRAEALMVPAYEIYRRTLGPEHPMTLTGAHNIADLRMHQNRLEEAASLATVTLEARARVLGPESANTLISEELLGTIYLQQEKFSEAEALLRRNLASREKLTPTLWRTAAVRSKLGTALLQQNQLPAAGALLPVAAEELKAREATIPAAYRSAITEAAARTAEYFTATGDSAAAERWRVRAATAGTDPDHKTLEPTSSPAPAMKSP
jgi:tetratricopeptide (TPR) repeat protein